MAEMLTMEQIHAEKVRNIPIKTGDILFCCGHKWVSRAIQAVTKAPFSHCGITWMDYGIGQCLILESVLKYGVRLSEVSKYLLPVNGETLDGPVLLCRMCDFDIDMDFFMLYFGTRQLTDPYSLLETAKIFSRLVFGIGRKTKSKGWICSELVAACLERVGVKVPTESGFVTPADVWRSPALTYLGRIA